MRVWAHPLLATVLFAAPLSAEPVDRCLGAHEGGQKADLEGKLSTARDRYRICSAASCPDLVRRDCTRRLAELESSMPTLSLSVTRDGKSVEGARVKLDGEEVGPGMKSLHLEPGEHVLVATAPDGASEERRVSLERGEHQELELELPAAPRGEKSSHSAKRGSVLPYVLGGVAVAGLAGFVGFALAGKSKQGELDDCKPRCKDPGLYDDMKQRYLFADISLGIAFCAGFGAYLSLPTGDAASKETGRPAMLRVGGRF